ncbi:DUF975 family protein [Lactobacillus sp. Sy-1]|uniref:DUF975 family protein n=1 Tax=Lactobacillus sp. Sy-1 TaxID=2109645 RepID=UPI001C570BFC|nr:DUF975 family protein [Lactobacillus sp. Sy-1]MBW1605104.1 DUF975 family protein [Lactobacillus sp. Sy-1]
MNFSTLKQNANQEFLKHFSFYFILFLPYLILQSIGGLLSSKTSSDLTNAIANGTNGLADVYSRWEINLSYLILFLIAIVSAGISLQVLSIIRHQSDHQHPFDKSTKIFSSPMLWGLIGTILLQFIFIILWMFVLIVPGLIKSFSYSQAIYIYRDAYVSGQKITPLQAITKSRQMMNGHKGELFILQLSFIGWFLLMGIANSFTIIPILGIFVLPYFQITMVNYYDQLRQL